MQPTCGTWSDCGIIGGGCCTDPELSKLDPRPSYGVCNLCPKNPARGRPMPAAGAATTVQVRIVRHDVTRALWHEIHTLALAGRLTDAKLGAILSRLPCGTCQADFTAIRQADPLPADPAQQFATTVRWHNAVNRKLGKPEMSVEDARKLYRVAVKQAA